MPNSKKTLFWITIIVLMVIVVTIVICKEIFPPTTSRNNIIFTGENGELYLINPDDSHQKPITHANWIITGKPLPSIIYKLPKQLVNFLNHETYFNHPSWSPDREWIACVSNQDVQRQNPPYFDIYLVATNGSKQIRITDIANNKWIAYPSWSPDGSQLTFSASDKDLNWNIFIINMDGTNLQQLTQNHEGGDDPDWSPGGKEIVFTSDRDGNAEIYIMKIDGSEQNRITHNEYQDFQPAWSSNGKQIVFTSNRDGNNEIYIMNSDGSGQKRLTFIEEEDWSPSWSPDGKQISFISERDGNAEIYVMNTNGSDQQRLTFTPENEKSPDWGP